MKTLRRSIGWHLFAGLAGRRSAGCRGGGWASTTQLSGAVIASGVVVVDSDVKKVQHPTGGVVSEINVRDDDYVKRRRRRRPPRCDANKANAAVYSKSLDELRARKARLEAEKDGAEWVIFPNELLEREKSDAEVSHVLQGERKLFSLRVEARTGQKAQLRERTAQIRRGDQRPR